MDHFEVLGISRDLATTGIQEVYLRLAKSFHPDRLPQELSDLKPQATKVFSRIVEAHQTLSDPTKRKTYVDSLKGGGGEDSEEEKVRRILRAAGSFQKAEVLLKKRMLAAAELEANRALEDDPDQPDYLALYAWIQSSKPDSEARLPELLKMLTDAVTRNPASEKNRYYRVQIYKRLGKIDEAVADCRQIVDKNPHHVDALREIRLWEMRRSPQKVPAGSKTTAGARPAIGKSPSKPPSSPPTGAKRSESPGGSLFGRLFKR
jgi:curved DNA-binding protein CbpA